VFVLLDILRMKIIVVNEAVPICVWTVLRMEIYSVVRVARVVTPSTWKKGTVSNVPLAVTLVSWPILFLLRATLLRLIRLISTFPTNRRQRTQKGISALFVLKKTSFIILSNNIVHFVLKIAVLVFRILCVPVVLITSI
jgi:hypothetical protein